MNVLGPNGTQMVEMGGSRAWLQRVKGDIVCSFQWLDIGEDEPHPCMCLFPAHRRMSSGAYVIPQRNAYIYADNRGNPDREFYAVAFSAAVELGFHPDKSTVHRVMDIVLDGIPDLIRMPSSQPSALDIKRHIAGIEAHAKINGQSVLQEVL